MITLNLTDQQTKYLLNQLNANLECQLEDGDAEHHEALQLGEFEYTNLQQADPVKSSPDMLVDLIHLVATAINN